MHSDLHSLSQVNVMIKYAADTNLLVLEHTGISLAIHTLNLGLILMVLGKTKTTGFTSSSS